MKFYIIFELPYNLTTLWKQMFLENFVFYCKFGKNCKTFEKFRQALKTTKLREIKINTHTNLISRK